VALLEGADEAETELLGGAGGGLRAGAVVVGFGVLGSPEAEAHPSSAAAMQVETARTTPMDRMSTTLHMVR
jgi:hypothetical protein